MKVYDAVADALVAEGARHVFCVMGDGNLDLLVALAHRGVRLVHARHEQNAVAMADGYARAGGGLALCAVTHGPGLTQTGTSLLVARKRQSPLLLLAGDTPRTNGQHVQNFDQIPFALATAGTVRELATPATATADLRAALVSLRADPRPIVVNMPTDVQLSELPDPVLGEWTKVPNHPGPGLPPPEQLSHAVDVIDRSRRPVLLVGRGAVESRSAAAVAALAEALDAPIVTTLLARGFLADHRLSVGVSGGLGSAGARTALDSADCVVALGSSLSTWSTRNGAALRDRAVVLVDRSADTWSGGPEPKVRLTGDVRLIAESLTEGVATDRPRRPSSWHGCDGGYGDDEIAARGKDEPIDPRQAMRVLDAALPEKRFVVVDGGHFMGFVCDHVTVGDASDFVFAPDFGAVGQGLGIAIGAAVARGTRTTLVVGDGGFLMNVQELDTAVRYDVPLTVVIVNDGGYGQEYHSLAAKGLPTDEALFETPDLARLAEGFGARGVGMRTLADLDAFEELLRGATGPTVVDVRVDRDVVHPATREIFATVRRGTSLPPSRRGAHRSPLGIVGRDD